MSGQFVNRTPERGGHTQAQGKQTLFRRVLENVGT